MRVRKWKETKEEEDLDVMEINGEAWLLERKIFQTEVVNANEMHFMSLHHFHKAYRF
jgi:hypothetical protein